MYKIALFSDIHGNKEALNAIVSDINKNRYDEVICLGDSIAIGPNSNECLNIIIANKYRYILGNHEFYYLYGAELCPDISESEKAHQIWIRNNLLYIHREFLLNCELEYKLNINNYNLSFKHFFYDINKKYPFLQLDILKDGTIENMINSDNEKIFFGHEHEPFIKQNQYYCVGSSGCTKNNKTHYTVITIDNDIKVEKIELEYDRLTFENKFKEIEYPERHIIGKIFFEIE